MILKTENLVSGYGGVEIVRNVNMAVEQGEIVSIIGRNGVGKSTLMKTIMGSVPAVRGNIWINEDDYTKRRIFERVKAGVSFVEQGHGIFPVLSVEENLIMGTEQKKATGANTFREVYEQFPILKQRRNQKAGTLSGGEQAMLSVARALVSNPKLIILDEPSEGVQPNVVSQIGEILKSFNRERGITIMLVEQNIKLIQQISERCYAVVKGEIVDNMDRAQLQNNDMIMRYLTV